eukprot:CAMPEP_0183390852 /NCGR_PEP_ID=MMETSP0370-20130417/6029_1 /TAXON_ID=268820 /ORGANISM="Peridinium aciculiferum, Strain PAER-2" /LENGTH=277 /DNA_ID=CAMNT_0025570461 /DNA_START=58 /DNA_END=888 /DNA_ORIENTATION=+
MWEVDVAGDSSSCFCCSCSEPIDGTELRFTWCPAPPGLEPRRGLFHAACAVRAGSRGPHARLGPKSVRHRFGDSLPHAAGAELAAILQAFASPRKKHAAELVVVSDSDAEEVGRGHTGGSPHSVAQQRPSRVCRKKPSACVPEPVRKKPVAANVQRKAALVAIRPGRFQTVQTSKRTRQVSSCADGSTEELKSKVSQKRLIKRGVTKPVEETCKRQDRHVRHLKGGGTVVTEILTIRRVRRTGVGKAKADSRKCAKSRQQHAKAGGNRSKRATGRPQ